MRVGIDARIIKDGYSGGVQQVIMGLASALSSYTTDDEFIFLIYEGNTAWLKPYMQGNCRLHIVPAPTLKHRIINRLRWLSFQVEIKLNPQSTLQSYPINHSDGTIQDLSLDVMHFVLQGRAFITDIPNIYHPWDLQHLHLPELFTPYTRALREHLYRTHCESATIVSVGTNWIKDDIVQHYSIDPEKIAVVPMGSVIETYTAPSPDALTAIRHKYALPDTFLLYPAQTWEHKNHIPLLEALALIRDKQGQVIPLICTGRRNAFYSRIEQCIEEHNLGNQVQFLDFVSETDLRGLYELATALVFPSLFEGWGLPITEALSVGLPILASDVTSLPEQIGSAGLLFDPYSVESMANAIQQLWNNPELQEKLSQEAKEQSEKFTWQNTASKFYILYNKCLNQA